MTITQAEADRVIDSVYQQFLADVRAVVVYQQGTAGLDEAMGARFVDGLLREAFEGGAHAGYAARRVRDRE